MRTTIEISERHRADLLKIAGDRGEKGFSSVVKEALDLYLKHHASREDATRAALALRGALKGKDGDELEDAVRKGKEKWR